MIEAGEKIKLNFKKSDINTIWLSTLHYNEEKENRTLGLILSVNKVNLH